MTTQNALKQLRELQLLNKLADHDNIYDVLEEFEINKAKKEFSEGVKELEKSLEYKYSNVDYLKPEITSDLNNEYTPSNANNDSTEALLKSLEDKYNGQEYL
ncbi:hypothetical protein P3573_13290 [Vibrio parahaemolyticus]|nr:hypothetical protein [Vibrio parahaemolyticus]MDF4969551.1 hypothetical protein [Vibrio parahaemolyticus]MDG2548377.1 hypothetical protein [Vibrio parahaemolyticus]MDG2558396.1 hypothetical protein [Vibrio parahaemolyticus]